ncbi:hypothetical protein LUI11_37015 [Bradyrhizobium diazoefficiens]|uniref:hypothetical protein n=1 Tax=Bradyrhizobium TaxID=374 RepID=UPI0004570673|nr:hypothetical protein [Bradyrhizobium diazoefficiens]APO55344.1 hypothetical protein BD122_33706 [Bradyrhizobium diazoefficiens]MCD9298010.1 hypothetical protein [Bradyrhizobium diazoefficiens]MCD9815525.1 hypothetical protein [Bradyrhizobium diazoefficiens]MCD9833453.1 hypothetical protein [Bradyrhizobium diazoefficiens]MCD9852121.1 hypothetical protein [Bradyrhizobium diazoefficiens]
MTFLANRRSIWQGAVVLIATLVASIRSARAAPTSVSLQCSTNDGADPQRKFAINFTPGNNGWSESEPGGTSDIFKTKSGNFVTVANTTSLRKTDPADTVVGILPNFNPSTAKQGDTGNTGKALETGRTFQWTVDLIIP